VTLLDLGSIEKSYDRFFGPSSSGGFFSLFFLSSFDPGYSHNIAYFLFRLPKSGSEVGFPPPPSPPPGWSSRPGKKKGILSLFFPSLPLLAFHFGGGRDIQHPFLRSLRTGGNPSPPPLFPVSLP